MDKNSVIVGSSYHFEMLGEWSDWTGDYNIVGYASPDVVNGIDPESNVRSIFFANAGYDDATYEKYVNISTLIYACVKIISIDPIVVDDPTNVVYIPSTLINMPASYVYTEANRFKFTVLTGVKHFDGVIATENFVRRAKIEMKDRISSMPDYAGDTISVEADEIEVLTTASVLKNIASSRDDYLSNKNLAIIENQKAIEAAERNLYEKILAAEKEKSNYEVSSKLLESKISEVEQLRSENESEITVLNKVKTIMTEMLSKLISGEIVASSLGSSGSEAFDNLYKQATDSI